MFTERSLNTLQVLTRHGSVDGLIKLPSSPLTQTLSADEVKPKTLKILKPIDRPVWELTSLFGN